MLIYDDVVDVAGGGGGGGHGNDDVAGAGGGRGGGGGQTVALDVGAEDGVSRLVVGGVLGVTDLGMELNWNFD